MRVLLIKHTDPPASVPNQTLAADVDAFLEVDAHKHAFSECGIEVVEMPKHWDGNLPECDAALLLGLSGDPKTGLLLIKGFKRLLGEKPLFLATADARDSTHALALSAGAEYVFKRPVHHPDVVRMVLEKCSKK